MSHNTLHVNSMSYCMIRASSHVTHCMQTKCQMIQYMQTVGEMIRFMYINSMSNDTLHANSVSHHSTTGCYGPQCRAGAAGFEGCWSRQQHFCLFHF